MRVLALHFVEKFGQRGERLVLLFFGIDLLLSLHGVLGDFEDGL